MYFAGGLVFVILGFRVAWYTQQTGAALGQLVGVAPTIIAVRVRLGYSVESVDSFMAPTPPTRIRFITATHPVDSGKDIVLNSRPASVKVERLGSGLDFPPGRRWDGSRTAEYVLLIPHWGWAGPQTAGQHYDRRYLKRNDESGTHPVPLSVRFIFVSVTERFSTVRLTIQSRTRLEHQL
ncbi:hypothetical protein FB451DRAFT_1176769 [Mycena latifolia]|nr:hypothetical protein FB451DRAFT_1176769 [Mycena latifolia]